MATNHRAPVEIAVAYGDGIGPEIMRATLSCLHAVGAPLSIREIDVGERVYLQGEVSGISDQSWDVLKSVQAFLKGPITTPQGKGFRSLNVTIRAALGLYANVRPCNAYAPFVKTLHPNMDVVIVRENEEDLYSGIEYHLSQDTKIALKVITEEGCRRVIRYAFEYARYHDRKKVTCFTKDNILKTTDGLFHSVFDEIREMYPTIASEHWIVDIGAAKLADTPEQFDVLVLPNLYGDILSDVTAQLAGSVGLGPSANIGIRTAMFEAIHGSAPRKAGQNVANPSGLMLSSIMMLSHLGLQREAELLHNAWLSTIEDGINTYDIYQELPGRKKVGTDEFARAVIERLGKKPTTLKPVSYHVRKGDIPPPGKGGEPPLFERRFGADLYIMLAQTDVEHIVQAIRTCEAILQPFGCRIENVSSRGSSIWPQKFLDRPISGNIIRITLHKDEGIHIPYPQFTQEVAAIHARLLESGVEVRGVIYL